MPSWKLSPLRKTFLERQSPVQISALITKVCGLTLLALLEGRGLQFLEKIVT